jgi:AraC family transcriptional regulator of adaptative response/methylated-DNA-[protein]-cysteine methyltransferase
MDKDITFETKYQAILKRDSSFEGTFITAVKSTGIFCRPVCSARKPKPENVEFFDSPHEALLHGYRPCKICKPMQIEAATPGYIEKLLEELNNDPSLRIKDYDLVKKGIDPDKLRRWFKKQHNMTFQSYQRMLRINKAYQQINQGDSVTATAFDSGFESISGFTERYKSIFNNAPSKNKDQQVINIIRFPTPIGPMYGCATTKGVCMAEFTDRRMLEREFKDLQRLLNAVILPGENPHLKVLVAQLNEYFSGKRKVFDVPLDTPGTTFQQSVWKLLQQIPFGETRSYKKQAELLGNSKAIRAVASANGNNRVSIVIPCHRVIGENGNLTGYGGGLMRKKWLLDHELKIK